MLFRSKSAMKLEQTGSTIFQTLAGLTLDIKKHPTERMLPGDQEDDDVQYLLNTFVLFNILEVFAILGLAYLDHKQKERAARRTSILSIPESLDESEDEDGAAKAARAEGEDDWQAEPSAGASAHSRRGSSFSRVSRASLSSPEQSIPLLGSGAHASTPRGSRYFIDAAAPEGTDRKSTRLNSSHSGESRMPSSA